MGSDRSSALESPRAIRRSVWSGRPFLAPAKKAWARERPEMHRIRMASCLKLSNFQLRLSHVHDFTNSSHRTGASTAATPRFLVVAFFLEGGIYEFEKHSRY